MDFKKNKYLLIMFLVVGLSFTFVNCTNMTPSQTPSNVVKEYSSALATFDIATAREYLDPKTNKTLNSGIGLMESVVGLTGININFEDLLSFVGPIFKLTKSLAALNGIAIPTPILQLINIENEQINEKNNESTLIASYHFHMDSYTIDEYSEPSPELDFEIIIKYSLRIYNFEWKIYKQEVLNQAEIIEYMDRINN